MRADRDGSTIPLRQREALCLGKGLSAVDSAFFYDMGFLDIKLILWFLFDPLPTNNAIHSKNTRVGTDYVVRAQIQKAFNEVYKSFNPNQSPFVVADFIIPGGVSSVFLLVLATMNTCDPF
jgi:hypothetical protein